MCVHLVCVNVCVRVCECEFVANARVLTVIHTHTHTNTHTHTHTQNSLCRSGQHQTALDHFATAEAQMTLQHLPVNREKLLEFEDTFVGKPKGAHT
jgi:hypothetical protein